MPSFFELSPFDEKGRIQMVVETPRGSTIKFKYEGAKGAFTISRSLAAGISYPFDWGFIPGTLSEDGDAVDALCLHREATFPGVVLPCRCLALVSVDQKSARGRIENPRLILAPAWQGAGALNVESELNDRAKAEIERFFLNATLFTDKDARILGWHDADAAEKYVRRSKR